MKAQVLEFLSNEFFPKFSFFSRSNENGFCFTYTHYPYKERKKKDAIHYMRCVNPHQKFEYFEQRRDYYFSETDAFSFLTQWQKKIWVYCFPSH